jgi:hypothetical protein
MALGESTDVTASLSSTPARADEDWYLLFGDRPRAVDVSVSGIPGTVVLLEAYDETRTRLAAVSAEAEGQPARFPNLTVRGKLLLRVSAARKGGGGAYTLSVRYGEPRPGMELEPNDRHADATELQPQGDAWTIQGLYGSPWRRGPLPHRARHVRGRRDAGTAADAGGAPTAAAPTPPVETAAEPRAPEGFPTQPPPLGGTRGEVGRGGGGARGAADRAAHRAVRRPGRAAGGTDPLRGRGHALHRARHGGSAALAAQRGGAGDGPGHRRGGEERLDRHRQGRPPRASTPSTPTPSRSLARRREPARSTSPTTTWRTPPRFRSTATARGSSPRRPTWTTTSSAPRSRPWSASS